MKRVPLLAGMYGNEQALPALLLPTVVWKACQALLRSTLSLCQKPQSCINSHPCVTWAYKNARLCTFLQLCTFRDIFIIYAFIVCEDHFVWIFLFPAYSYNRGVVLLWNSWPLRVLSFSHYDIRGDLFSITNIETQERLLISLFCIINSGCCWGSNRMLFLPLGFFELLLFYNMINKLFFIEVTFLYKSNMFFQHQQS